LASLAQGSQVLVNSHHHQAVEKVGRELVATAWTSDGMIEAVEDSRPDRFAMGVQWHPELGWKGDRLSQALFARFVAATKEIDRKNVNQALEGETVSHMEEEAPNGILTREKRAGES
jgi:gamma-glutamyl-gamma-aminobutyrate hydrolase PuuD